MTGVAALASIGPGAYDLTLRSKVVTSLNRVILRGKLIRATCFRRAIELCQPKVDFARPTSVRMVDIVLRMNTRAHISLYETLTVEFGMTDRDIMREVAPSRFMIARAIGLPSYLMLMEEYAGREINIPIEVHERNRIAQVIGIEAAEKLHKAVGGNCKIEATHNFGLADLIRLAGYKMIREGHRNVDIAVELGVSRTTVKAWKLHVPPDDARPCNPIFQRGQFINLVIDYLKSRQIDRWAGEAA